MICEQNASYMHKKRVGRKSLYAVFASSTILITSRTLFTFSVGVTHIVCRCIFIQYLLTSVRSLRAISKIMSQGVDSSNIVDAH